MSQIKEITQKLSFVFGRKPIVYFVTDEIDLIDMIFAQSSNFCAKDIIGGELRLIDKLAYTKTHYNASDNGAWRSLVKGDGAITKIPKLSAESPTYCYIKNFDYIYAIKRKDMLLYATLMDYITQYTMASQEVKDKNILVLSGSSFIIPDGLSQFVEVIDVPYPDVQDIMTYFEAHGIWREDTPISIKTFWEEWAVAMKGFTGDQIVDLLKMILSEYGDIADMSPHTFERYKEDIAKGIQARINDIKIQMVEKDGALKFIEYPQGVAIDGCQKVIDYIESRKEILLHPDRYPYVTPPKGMLFAGVPGSGKSLMAEKVASLLNVPLLQLDMGSMLGKMVGESEGRLRRALKMAEAVAPCVLWIDEIDKAFSRGDESSHETSKRMFGYMLGWMQQLKKPVFIYATANYINNIDSALLRSGRFDSKFFAFMPDAEQCGKILMRRIECRKGMLAQTEQQNLQACIRTVLDTAAKYGKFFNGADIETLVNATVMHLYRAGYTPPFAPRMYFAAMQDELKSMSTYGQSNISEIAQYWLQNYFGNIELGDTPLFPNQDFDLENIKKSPSSKDKKPSYFLERRREDFQNNSYNFALYSAITSAIDMIPYEAIVRKYRGIR